MGNSSSRRKTRRFLAYWAFLFALTAISTSCGFRTRSTSIRGYVHSGDQKVTGGDVRFGTKTGGSEATTQIGIDGRFRITLEHPAGAKLEVKVLQPGFEHDPIEFNAESAPQGEMDINLRRVFKPGTESKANNSSNAPANK
jgi:hypothetical protein